MKKIVKRFGDYIKTKRKDKGKTLRATAEKLNISAVYLSDIESNRRNPLKKDKLETLAKYLGLSEEEQYTMYDLAGRDNNGVPKDIEEIFMYTEIGDIARKALRKTINGNISLVDWKKLLREEL